MCAAVQVSPSCAEDTARARWKHVLGEMPVGARVWAKNDDGAIKKNMATLLQVWWLFTQTGSIRESENIKFTQVGISVVRNLRYTL